MDKLTGFKFAGIHCGVKKEKKDLGIILCEDGANCVGVFTKNRFASPTISESKRILKSNKINAVVVNSGNANCLTGQKGHENIKALIDKATATFQLEKDSTLSLSTGIIGVQLPIEKIVNGIEILKENVSDSITNYAQAILTTDLIQKQSERTILIDGQEVNILGVAKGSGMIQPNMATMLAFIMTDATIDKKLLQKSLNNAVNTSFNAITVDSDSSTNDTCLLLASNKGAIINEKNCGEFNKAVKEVAIDLAKLIIKDAEGATKFVTVNINNATNEIEAKNIFYAISNSPLVKTAIFGENPNFGRILCSAGKINSNIDPDKTDLYLGEHLLYTNGAVTEQNKSELDSYMKHYEIEITLDLNIGDAGFTGWTSDLSHAYVDINAEYN